MIKCFHGDVNVVNFELALIEKNNEGKRLKYFYSPKSFDEICQSYFSQDIFSSTPKFDICVSS